MSWESEEETYETLGRYCVQFEQFCSAMESCIGSLLHSQGLVNSDVQEILLDGMTAAPLLSKLHSLVNAVVANNEEEQKVFSKVFSQFQDVITERNIIIHSKWKLFALHGKEQVEFHLMGHKLGANKAGAATKISTPQKEDLESSIRNCRDASLQVSLVMRIVIGYRTLSECFEIKGKILNVKYEALKPISLDKV